MITGARFNEQYEGIRFVKLTNESCCHKGYQYKEGLNENILEFNPNADCSPGRILFLQF